MKHVRRRGGLEPLDFTTRLSTADSEPHVEIGASLEGVAVASPSGDDLDVEVHATEREDHVVLGDREVVHHRRPGGVEGFGLGDTAVSLNHIELDVGFDGLIAVDPHLARPGVDLRMRRGRHAEHLAVEVPQPLGFEGGGIHFEGRRVFHQGEEPSRVRYDVGVGLNGGWWAFQDFVGANVAPAKTINSFFLFAHEALRLCETTAAGGLAVIEAKGIDQRVPVEKMQCAVSRRGSGLLVGSIAIEGPVEFAWDHAIDVRDRVVGFDRMGSADRGEHCVHFVRHRYILSNAPLVKPEGRAPVHYTQCTIDRNREIEIS